MFNSVTNKAKDAYPTSAPGTYSKFFLMDAELSIYSCFFLRFFSSQMKTYLGSTKYIVVNVYQLLKWKKCVVVFVPGLHSLDYSYNIGSLDYFQNIET